MTGVNSGALTTGGISGLGGVTGSTAANWAGPTGPTYASAPSYDYYVLVGWSANEGASWSTVSCEIQNSTLINPGWFGESVVLYNYAGEATLNAPNVFSPSAFTGLAGSGYSGSNPALTLLPVPEPATLALAGLGGVSMLFLRRRKS